MKAFGDAIIKIGSKIGQKYSRKFLPSWMEKNLRSNTSFGYFTSHIGVPSIAQWGIQETGKRLLYQKRTKNNIRSVSFSKSMPYGRPYSRFSRYSRYSRRAPMYRRRYPSYRRRY